MEEGKLLGQVRATGGTEYSKTNSVETSMRQHPSGSCLHYSLGHPLSPSQRQLVPLVAVEYCHGDAGCQRHQKSWQTARPYTVNKTPDCQLPFNGLEASVASGRLVTDRDVTSNPHEKGWNSLIHLRDKLLFQYIRAVRACLHTNRQADTTRAGDALC